MWRCAACINGYSHLFLFDQHNAVECISCNDTLYDLFHLDGLDHSLRLDFLERRGKENVYFTNFYTFYKKNIAPSPRNKTESALAFTAPLVGVGEAIVVPVASGSPFVLVPDTIVANVGKLAEAMVQSTAFAKMDMVMKSLNDAPPFTWLKM
jgi:hypothetical protein